MEILLCAWLPVTNVCDRQRSKLRARHCRVFRDLLPSGLTSPMESGSSSWYLIFYGRVCCLTRGICPVSMFSSEMWVNEGCVTGLKGLRMVSNVGFLFCTWWSGLWGYELQAGESLSAKVQLLTVWLWWEEGNLGSSRNLGQEGSFLCSLTYLGIARLLSVCCSDQRGGQSYLNRSSAVEPRTAKQPDSSQS